MELVGELAGPDRPAAMELMNRLRDPAFAPDFLKLVSQRRQVLSAAYLSEFLMLLAVQRAMMNDKHCVEMCVLTPAHAPPLP